MSNLIANNFAHLLFEGRFEELSSALEVARPEFLKQNDMGVWGFWKAQLHLARKEPEAALALAEMIVDPRASESIRGSATWMKSQLKGDNEGWLSYLRGRFAASNRGIQLYELCEALWQTGKGAEVAKSAEELVNKMPTPSAIRLAVSALQQSGEFTRALNLLENSALLFPDGSLPDDLVRRRIWCEQQRGRLNEVLPIAEQLARKTGHPSDLAQVMGLKLGRGDIRGLAITARELLPKEDVPSHVLLQAARVAYLDDPQLARKLFEKAASSPSNTAREMLDRFELTWRFHKPTELREAHRGIAEVAQHDSGPIRSVKLDQIPEILQERGRIAREIEERYRRGLSPIHVTLDVLGVSLPILLEQSFHPPRDKRGGYYRPPLFTHHGRRTPRAATDATSIYLDLTTLLLAAELELLSVFEKAFEDILIPPSIPTFLVNELDQLAREPGIKAKVLNEILELAKAGDIRSFTPPDSFTENETLPETLPRYVSEIFSEIRLHDGRLVDFLPLRGGVRGEPISMSPEWSERLSPVEAVVESLSRAGRLSEAELSRARELLPTTGSQNISFGTHLYMSASILELLGMAGLLKETCRYFQLFVSLRELAAIEDECRASLRRARTQEKLRSLLDVLTLGQESGKWKLITLSSHAKQDTDEATGLASVCVRELLQAKAMPGAYICTDDRFFNGHQLFGELPILSTVDLLTTLRVQNAISEKDFYAWLHSMRSAELRYLPLTSDELIYRLAAAPIKDGVLQETPELAAIRRSTGRYFLDKGCVQLPVPSPEHGEAELVLSYYRAAHDGLLAQWRSDSSTEEERRARADWIFYQLWFDPSALPILFPEADQEMQPSGYFMSLGHLVVEGITLKGRFEHPAAPETSPRQRFFSWLFASIGKDHNTLEYLGERLREYLCDERLIGKLGIQDAKIEHLAFQNLYFDLPEELRENVLLPKARRRQLGIGHAETVTIGPAQFAARKLWEACSKVALGQTAEIKEFPRGNTYRIRYQRNPGSSTLHFEPTEKGSGSFSASDVWFTLLEADKQKVAGALNEKVEWLEIEQTPRRVAADIANLPSPVKRIMRALSLRAESATWNYEQLSAKLRKPQEVHLSDFSPPAVKSLLAHLRFPLSTSVTARISGAGENLSSEVGLFKALQRCSYLPVSMPEKLISEIRSLNRSDQDAILHNAEEAWRSPVSRLHLIRIAMLCGKNDRALKIAAELSGDDNLKSFGAFLSILHWTALSFEHRKGSDAIPPEEILVCTWAHSAILYDLLRSVSDDATVQQYFEQVAAFAPADSFIVRKALATDVAHPRTLRASGFLLHGMADALRECDAADSTVEEIRTLIRKQVFQSPESSMPRIEILPDPAKRPNATGSYLGEERGALLGKLLGEEAKTFGSDQHVNDVRDAIEKAAKNPSSVDAWVTLAALLGIDYPNSESEGQLAEALRNLRFKALEDSNPRARQLAILFAMSHARNDEVRTHLRVELCAFASQWAEREIERRSVSDGALLLLEAAHAWASGLEHSRQRLRAMVLLLRDLVALWPELSDEWSSSMPVVLMQLPPSLQFETWPLLLLLRSHGDQLATRKAHQESNCETERERSDN